MKKNRQVKGKNYSINICNPKPSHCSILISTVKVTDTITNASDKKCINTMKYME